MATFEEFRSSFPEESGEKGEIFEAVLCEWFLKTEPHYSHLFRRVWRFKDWPKRWSSKDIGTDLIAQDRQGKIWAIQAKFYHPKRKIPKEEIDSFLSDSNRREVDYRLLIATSQDVGENAKNTVEGQQKPVLLYLLDDFLKCPIVWPKNYKNLGQGKVRKPHKPRPHQKAAIKSVVKKLGDRGQLIMACGTGKTLTGQRITEELNAKSTLVLLPSLLLLSKTLSDWLSEQVKEFECLAVCSDQSVGTPAQDQVSLSNSALKIIPTTDPKSIAEFLGKKGDKVIFSTYQSSPRIAKAFKRKKLKRFDLIIADEAHRCAGRVSSDFSTVLDDTKIPAKRRLFMTATPRLFKKSLQRAASDSGIEVASMNDESVFGPVVHRLSFGEAIKKKLLADYRVVIVGVNDAEYLQMVQDRALIKTETNLKDDARSFATQIGLAKAVKKYDLKRVITFHSRVNLAKNFAEGFVEFLAYLKRRQRPSGRITYDFVSGAMPTSQRNDRLRALGELLDEDRFLLGNARCLSEGVDVPALDGVAFVDPRRSEVDIVQAVGRAIRLSPEDENKVGTIVVPVFISDSEDPDAVLNDSEFDQVWKVINALRAHDDDLGEELDSLRTQLARKQKIKILGEKIHFDVHRTISRRFVESFETKLVESATQNFEFWFGLLLDYKEDHGNLRLGSTYKTEEGYGLGFWVSNTRTNYANGKLSQDQIDRLESIGFIWDELDRLWEEGFSNFEQYLRAHGNALVPGGFRMGDGYNLGQWVTRQRGVYEEGEMAEERLYRLEAAGFIWDALDHKWNVGYDYLQKYKSTNGHVLVGARTVTDDGFELGGWVGTQRGSFKKGKLSEERVSLLEGLGFVWDRNQHRWEEGYQHLLAFKSTEGHINFGQSYKTEGGFALGNWVSKQREAYSNGELPKDRIDRLESVGFVWDSLVSSWEISFLHLVEYHRKNGHVEVPATFKTVEGHKLGQWVTRQRAVYENGDMSEERVKRLESVGFTWDVLDSRWELAFQDLQEYKLSRGNMNPPRDYKGKSGTNLGVWVTNQRKQYKEQKMPKERVIRLENLGLEWDGLERLWEEGFQYLLDYQVANGDLNVAQQFVNEANFRLGRWVNSQRQNHKNKKLSAERAERLQSIGFIFDPLVAKWEAGFSRLRAYKDKYGNLDVAASYKAEDGYSTGSWAHTQRMRYKRGDLPRERISRLESLGFRWSADEKTIKGNRGQMRRR